MVIEERSVLSDIYEDTAADHYNNNEGSMMREESLGTAATSLLARINPEISVIQKIYKVILQRHEIVQSTKQTYTRLKLHNQFDQ